VCRLATRCAEVCIQQRSLMASTWGVSLPRQHTCTRSCRSLLHAYAHIVVTCLCIGTADIHFCALSY
jgi:hypothetical protein